MQLYTIIMSGVVVLRTLALGKGVEYVLQEALGVGKGCMRPIFRIQIYCFLIKRIEQLRIKKILYFREIDLSF